MLALFLCSVALADTPAATPADALPPALEARVAEVGAWLDAAPEEVDGLARRLVLADDSLPRQTGTVVLADGAVELALPDGLAYLDPDATAGVLENWGNPPGIQTLGMIASGWVYGPDTWAVVVDYEEDGWIDDGDAASIDYADLLADMKAADAEANAEREAHGLATLHLREWAEAPHYDPSTKVLYWAKHLEDSQGEPVLNYDVRVLGRHGVLSLNAVADLDALPAIRGAMEPVRAAARFTEGNRYADYQPGDPTAAYGLAALVAGGAIASKTGLLKGLIAMLLAGKKFVILGVVAVLAGLRTLLGRKRDS